MASEKRCSKLVAQERFESLSAIFSHRSFLWFPLWPRIQAHMLFHLVFHILATKADLRRSTANQSEDSNEQTKNHSAFHSHLPSAGGTHCGTHRACVEIECSSSVQLSLKRSRLSSACVTIWRYSSPIFSKAFLALNRPFRLTAASEFSPMFRRS